MPPDATFGRNLMTRFDQDGTLGETDTVDYRFFWDPLGILQDELDANRFSPAEEPVSYTGINHSFVEPYCPYFFNESNDANGVLYSTFQASGVAAGNSYALTPWSERGGSYGGQTQLVRIRIIQVLNEYYGDWKWVNICLGAAHWLGSSDAIVPIRNPQDTPGRSAARALTNAVCVSDGVK